MEWFRWWHGTVTDPKFKWIVKRSGASLTEIIAVWASLLEHASSVTQCDAPVTSHSVTSVTVTRGDIRDFCCDDFDLHFDFEEGKTQRIITAFEEKGLIEKGMISNWKKRQPKREDSSAERTKAYRERKKATKIQNAHKECDASVTHGDATVTQRDAGVTHGDSRLDTDTEKYKYPSSKDIRKSSDLLSDSEEEVIEKIKVPKKPECPHLEIIALYHETLPDNPQVMKWTPTRKSHLQARWKEEPDLEAWRKFFKYVSKSDFLTGKINTPGRRPFLASLDWLINSENYAKILEGKYHGS